MTLKGKTGPLISIVLAVILITWMIIGGNGITASPTPSKSETDTSVAEQTPISSKDNAYPVQVKTFTHQTVEIRLPLSGQTLADDTLTLTNSYSGKITHIYREKGDFIKKGQAILQIDTRTLKQQIKEAELLIKQRNLELDGIKQLAADSFSSKVNVAQAETNLATAKSSHQTLLVELENANITAPFSGILNTFNVQVGQVLSQGSNIGTLVSVDPLKISVDIPQNKIHFIELGTLGEINLESGMQTQGVVTYINTLANNSSRTINAEVQIPNPNNAIPAGITASVNFILETQLAHTFSPALLTLDDNGKTAVKAVDINNQVQIYPVEIIKSERSKVWVTGLPESVQIITVGHGFVSEGDIISPHYKNGTTN